jgi:hypothetical protein
MLGYATWRGGKLYLLHASSDYKKVMITHQPLADYLMANKRLSGVRVARVKSTAARMADTLPAPPFRLTDRFRAA